MSYDKLIETLKAINARRDESGKFSASGHRTEGWADPDETERGRKRKARLLKLRAEQNARRSALTSRQRERRNVPEAKI